MTTLAPPKVALKLVPVPKPILYAGLAGELLKNTGMKDDQQIRAVQQAVSEGILEKVIVAATRTDGRVEKFTVALKPFQASETVSLQLENGKSYLETLDVGLAAAVQAAADIISRQGLTPRFYVEFSARAKATPAIIADAMRRLNLKTFEEPASPPQLPEIPWAPAISPSPPATPPVQRYPQTVHAYKAPPPLPPGYVYKPVLSVTPVKDPGVSFTWETTRKA